LGIPEANPHLQSGENNRTSSQEAVVRIQCCFEHRHLFLNLISLVEASVVQLSTTTEGAVAVTGAG
jgi:hypothetical protein